MTNPKVSLFKIIKFGLKIYIKTIPFIFVLINIIGIIHGVSQGFSTFMTQRFYDSVESVLVNGEPISKAFLMVAALGAAFIAKELLNGIHNFMHGVVFGKVNGETAQIIHKKMAAIDPACLEDTKLHDDIEKAEAGAGTVLGIVGIGMTIFTFYVPYFMFMGAYLHYLKPRFVLAILMIFLPVLISQFIRTVIMSKFENKAAPVRREYDYYHKTIADREYYKETRILGAYGFFLGRFLDSLKRLSKAEWEASRRTNLLELGMAALSAAGYIGILLMLVNALLAGEITAGAFAAVFGSIGMMFGIMEEMIKSHIGKMAEDMGKAQNFIRFMELPERGGADAEPDFSKGIEACNVSFTYPNAEQKSVDNVSLRISAGETIAIVGGNGAGKTTLVRLLTGLYVPTSGTVALNGMDTSRANGQSVSKGLSGVFQRFQKYQMTLNENVRISDSGNKADITGAVNQAGVAADGASFPEGYETMLSREFEGVDLSGGEWQRVAIARGLYRVHNTVVLDEPTAAIDPLEESRIYRQFVEISKGKTAIIVTHRLGSVKIADHVVVMDKGRIVDSGTHNELIKKRGLYADMYNSQASWYSDEESV